MRLKPFPFDDVRKIIQWVQSQFVLRHETNDAANDEQHAPSQNKAHLGNSIKYFIELVKVTRFQNKGECFNRPRLGHLGLVRSSQITRLGRNNSG